jgi:hypothetical protein
MMSSEIPAPLGSQIASHIRGLDVLNACPAFSQIPEKVASDGCPASDDVPMVAFPLQVFSESRKPSIVRTVVNAHTHLLGSPRMCVLDNAKVIVCPELIRRASHAVLRITGF